MLGIPTQSEIAIDWSTVVFNMINIKAVFITVSDNETWYKIRTVSRLQSGSIIGIP